MASNWTDFLRLLQNTLIACLVGDCISRHHTLVRAEGPRRPRNKQVKSRSIITFEVWNAVFSSTACEKMLETVLGVFIDKHLNLYSRQEGPLQRDVPQKIETLEALILCKCKMYLYVI